METSRVSIIDAIQQGRPISIELDQRWGQWPKIILHIDGSKIGHVACVRYAQPTAIADGSIVRIKSSDRLPGGFGLKCVSDQEAQQISELFAICLRNAFEDLFGKQ